MSSQTVLNAWNQPSDELINNLKQSQALSSLDESSEPKGKQNQNQQRKKKTTKSNAQLSFVHTNPISGDSETPSSTSAHNSELKEHFSGPVRSHLNLKEIDDLFNKLYVKAQNCEKKPYKFSDKTIKKDNNSSYRRPHNFEEELNHLKSRNSFQNGPRSNHQSSSYPNSNSNSSSNLNTNSNASYQSNSSKKDKNYKK